MNKFLWRVLIAITLISTMIGMALPVSSAGKPIDYSPIDAGVRIREMPATADMVIKDEQPAGQSSALSSTDCITDTKIFLILNDYLGRYQATYFNLMGDSDKAQVWVQANLAWPTGDPRATPVITCEQVQYILDQFEDNIIPEETNFFGEADPLDGTYAYLPGLLGLPADYYYDAAGRAIILVSNVRDENYYVSTYPIYIAGFYSPSFEVYFDRNVITIDAYDWANRTGPNPHPDPDPLRWRPYLYEGIVAHEWQHLLHDDYDPDEENFINEGMAEYAEIVCGYTAALQGHIDAAASNPENSLTAWGDQGDLEILTDYGQAGLFQIYLNERFGRAFTQALFHNEYNSISGVNDTLSQLGIYTDFAELYHNFSVAMYINSAQAGGKYAIKAFPTFKLNVGTYDTPNPEAYITPGAPPWGTDYIWLGGEIEDFEKLSFNGMDYSMLPTAWTSDGDWLWSGTGDLLDNWAIFETTGGGLLSFDTIWDLEDYWDFGFVQVSTDSGYTWTSLEDNEGYSVYDYDPNAHPKVIANVPGLTSYITEPVTLTYDLSAYEGQDILVAFRLVTDWATSYTGWWIDNVYVDDTLISDGTDASVFKDITEVVPINNDFTVTFVGQKASGKGKVEWKVISLGFNSDTEDRMFELKQMFKWATSVVMLVTFDAPEGFTNYADYTYEWVSKTPGPKK